MNLFQRVSLYHLVIVFLLSLYFLGAFKFGLQKVLWQVIPAVCATLATDAILKYVKFRRWVFSLSALISGLIIGLVAQFGEKVWVLVFIAITAMVIKFFIRWDGKHIFNPAASGLMAGLVFSSYPSWWVGGNNLWIFLIWIPILLIKQRRWAPILAFLLPLVIFNGLTILISVTMLFFISVMLIEPKTSPFDTKIGLFYGLIVVSVYLLSNFVPAAVGGFDPLIVALLIGNLGARLLQKYLV